MNTIPSSLFDINNAVMAVMVASEKPPGIYCSLVAVCSLRHGICAESGNCDSCETRKKIQGINI